jgi:hypothetical protein
VAGKAKIDIDKTITYNYKPDPQCTNVQTWAYNHLSYEGDVKGTWVCTPDGARLDLTAGSTRTLQGTITNSCNTNRLDRTDTAFAVIFSALFKTDDRQRDRRRVSYGVCCNDGSTLSGANTGIFDLHIEKQ